MNTRTRISKKNGSMQINLDNWSFWFKGGWYTLNAKTIGNWTEKLTGADREWFVNSIYG
jgi:hypothetical protein